MSNSSDDSEPDGILNGSLGAVISNPISKILQNCVDDDFNTSANLNEPDFDTISAKRSKRQRTIPFKLKDAAAAVSADKTKNNQKPTKKNQSSSFLTSQFSSASGAIGMSTNDVSVGISKDVDDEEQDTAEQDNTGNEETSAVKVNVHKGDSQLIQTLRIDKRILESNEVGNIMKYAKDRDMINQMFFTFICCLALEAVHKEGPRVHQDQLAILYATEYNNIYANLPSMTVWNDRLFKHIGESQWPEYFANFSNNKKNLKPGKFGEAYAQINGPQHAQLAEFGHHVEDIGSKAKAFINNECNKLAREIASGENKTQVLEAIRYYC